MADTHSSYSKIKRAKKHIADANELLSKSRPFTYTFEYNTKTGECSTGAKRNEAVIGELALVCGDAVHCLRSALDHVIWSILSPLLTARKELQRVQFPFGWSKENFEGVLKNRLVERAGPEVIAAVEGLKPYPGGDDHLYLVHDLDMIDKHKLLIPAGDYSTLVGERIRREIPDFPPITGNFGMNRRDVGWRRPPVPREVRRANHLPEVIEQELNVPVAIVFRVGISAEFEVAPTLLRMTSAVENAVGKLIPFV